MEGEYPPLQSVPRPTLTPNSLTLTISNDPAPRETFELGQWLIPLPASLMALSSSQLA